VKPTEAIICGGILVLAFCGSSALADSPEEEAWEARKEQMEYEREQRKREREWEREERKHYREMAREEREHQEEMWREGGYAVEQPDYGYGVDDAYEPEYIEDKVYRIIKDVRDLAGGQ
jgi:hypothetical protein